jgi:transcriptional regulator with XRE-family HTH domain
MSGQTKDKGLFAQKLEHLFQTKRKPDGSEYSEVEIEVATAQAVTHSYIYRLRRGLSQNPSYEKIKALATFFKVAPGYFFEEDSDDLPEAVTATSPLFTLDLQSVALRAEKIEDEAVKEVMLQVLSALKEVRDKTEATT